VILDDALFRPLAAQIDGGPGKSKMIAIAATEPGEGVSTTVVNLARTLETYAGRRVLVVDANIADPQIHHFYGLPRSPGITEAWRGAARLREVLYVSGNGTLGVVPAGGIQNASWPELFQRDGLPSLIDPMRAAGFDIVLVDLPPLSAWPEAVAIAAKCDQTFMVVASESTGRDAADRSRIRLTEAGAYVSGVILNRTRQYGPRYLTR
jgi:capsular exopolysaccharide synthesis family protein